MSTFAEKNVRIFRTKSVEDISRLRRKRSCGRLKCFASNTDNRAWTCGENPRRRHILELLRYYDPNLGNYIPLDVLFGILFDLADKEKSTILNEAMRSIDQIDTIIKENDDMDKKLNAAEKKRKELETQKKELSSLATCLSRAGGDLRKQNACLKSEIDRLKKKLAELEKELQKRLPQDEKKRRKDGKGGEEEKGGKESDLDQVREAEQRTTELLCEIEALQKCLEKAECDAIQMVHIIEQQQAKISCLQMCECKLKDVAKQRDLLKRQLECSSGNDGMNSFSMRNNSLSNVECQKKQMEMERNQLQCQLQMIEEELRMKDKDLSCLNRKLCKQNECINSLKKMLATSEKDPKGENVIPTSEDPKGENVIPVDNSSSETYTKDLEEMQCKMKEMQSKVCQQAQIIISQRKCLLEQHKYIVEQEQVRCNIQNRVRDQARKQAELVYERNLLRNEIVFLTARLKTYLGKIQLLEKSIEQLFDTTKSSKCDEECLDEPGFLDQNSRKSVDQSSRKSTCCPPSSASPLSRTTLGGRSSMGREKSSCGPCASNRCADDTNPLERYKNFRNLQNQCQSNRAGCSDIPNSLSNDTLMPFMMPSSSSNDVCCPSRGDKNKKKSMFCCGGLGVDSNSSMSFTLDNCNGNNTCTSQLPSCFSDDQFSLPVRNTGNLSSYGNSNMYSSPNPNRFSSRNLPERDQGMRKKGCRPCS